MLAYCVDEYIYRSLCRVGKVDKLCWAGDAMLTPVTLAPVALVKTIGEWEIAQKRKAFQRIGIFT